MADTKENISILTNVDRENLLNKSTKRMPENPSQKGFSGNQVKASMYEPCLLLFKYIQRLIEEIGTSFDEYDDRIEMFEGGYQVKYSKENVIGYESEAEAVVDLPNLILGQMVLIKNDGKIKVYFVDLYEERKILSELPYEKILWGCISGEITDQEDLIEYLDQLPYVRNSGNETVGGVKHFSSLPTSSEGREYDGNGRQFADQEYVDGVVEEFEPNFFYVVRAPASGLPFLNTNHGWYVYFAHLACAGLILEGAVSLPYIIKERKAK